MNAPSHRATTSAYNGKGIAEYNNFHTLLTTHFMINTYFYVNDYVKVSEGLQCLNKRLVTHWTQHVKELKESPTFDNFMEFLKIQVEDLRVLWRKTTTLYHNSKQRPRQSIQDFTRFIID